MDDLRFNYWGGGLSATLRDIARFGEVIRNDGLSAAGKQIIPKSIVRDSKDNGNASQFERSNGVSEQAGSATFVSAYSLYSFEFVSCFRQS